MRGSLVAFVLLGLVTIAQQAPPRLLRLHVTVTRGNEFVTDLPQQAFTVLEDGKPQTIATFERADEPVSAVLVLDVSGSMRDYARSLSEAAKVLVNGLHPDSEVGIVSFSDVASLDQRLTQERSVITALLPQPRHFRGGSILRDGCSVAVDYLVTAAKYRKKVVVMFSDGGDTQSRATTADVQAILAGSDILLYALQPEEDGMTRSERNRTRGQLEELASPTGGLVYQGVKPADLEQAAARIAREIRSQYMLTYSPVDQSLNGKFRKVSVKVEPAKGIRVRTRPGYYATK